MAAEIPVFVIVPSTSLAAFEAFSEGVGEAVVGGTDDIADWCLDAAGKAVS